MCYKAYIRVNFALSHFALLIAVSDTIPPSASTGSAPIDLHTVRRLFSQPERIIESEFLRREIASRMFERLSLVKISPQQVLDAGCGTGADLSLLKSHFPQAQIIGLDAAPNMLLTTRNNDRNAQSTIHQLLTKLLPAKLRNAPDSQADLLCGNFAQLPLRNNSIDLVWSNLALHWHPQPDRIFMEWRRVLRQDGLLMFSCFGPDTFKEIRAAFAVVDSLPHTLSFVDMHDFGDMLVHAGFSTPVMDMETITVTYASVEKLLTDVRAWGGNPLDSRRKGLIGKRAWQRMAQQLESTRKPDGKIPLTFEIVYGHAFRPAPRITSTGETIVRLDLDRKKGG